MTPPVAWERQGRALSVGRLSKSGKLWVLDWRGPDGKRHRQSLSSDKYVAERMRIELVRNRDMERAGLRGELGQERLLAELAALYISDLRARATERHVTNVQATLDRVLAAMPAKRVRELVAFDLMRLRSARVQEGLSVRTANLDVATLKAMLNWAARAGLIAQNPIARLPPLPEREASRRYRRRALTELEIERFLEAARADDRRVAFEGSLRRLPRVEQHPLWRTLLETGCRWGELTQAAWADVDLERGVLYLRSEHTKAGRAREIPLLAGLCDELRALHAGNARVLGRPLRPDERVFLSPRGKPWCRPTNNVMRAFDRILEAAGIDRKDAQGRKLDVHALRTTFGSRLARRGVGLVQAQRLLGHSDPKLTSKHYVQLEAEDLRQAIEKLESVKAGRASIAG